MINVKILAVESGNEADSLDVLLSIGEEKKSFRFIREFDLIGGHKIQIIKHEDKFWETFKFNQHIVFKVTELVLGKIPRGSLGTASGFGKVEHEGRGDRTSKIRSPSVRECCEQVRRKEV